MFNFECIKITDVTDNCMYSTLNGIATATAGLVLSAACDECLGLYWQLTSGTGEVLACVQISQVKGN